MLEQSLKKLVDLKTKKGKLDKEISELEKSIQEELGKYGIPFLKYVTTPTVWVGSSTNYPINGTNFQYTYYTTP